MHIKPIPLPSAGSLGEAVADFLATLSVERPVSRFTPALPSDLVEPLRDYRYPVHSDVSDQWLTAPETPWGGGI